MKKILNLFIIFLSLFAFISCSDEAWTTDPDMEHIYYVGFFKAGVFSDALNYEIAADGTARWRVNSTTWNVTGSNSISSDIPVQFHSERVRSYDAVTYIWVTNNAGSTLTAGTDYAVLDDSGNTISQTDGKYAITWPQAKKGVQNLKIKRLTSTNGVLKVNTLDPSKGTPSTTEENYIESTRNNKSNDYEVRGLTHDFNKVTVTFN